MQNPIIVRISAIGGGQTKGLNPFAEYFSRYGSPFFACVNIFSRQLWVSVACGFKRLSSQFFTAHGWFWRNITVSPFCAEMFFYIKEDFYV